MPTELHAVQGEPPDIIRQAADIVAELLASTPMRRGALMEKVAILHAARGMLDQVIPQAERAAGMNVLHSGPNLPEPR